MPGAAWGRNRLANARTRQRKRLANAITRQRQKSRQRQNSPTSNLANVESRQRRISPTAKLANRKLANSKN
uniref:Uncharacterized protein n=1 Tax=Ditylenchus dipsaci TaxID=166011 RepID=A0A915EDL9_9BILA